MAKKQKSRTNDMYDGDARHPGCALAKNFNPVELPDQIVAAAAKGTLTVFAGAGISTESRIVFPYSFYEEIRDALPKGTPQELPFSELMTRFCSNPNGRRDLLRRLRDRFAYIDSFPELLRLATRFHEELATLPHLDNIITTNWDDYFERFCGATAFVTPQDFVFWNVPGRKVLKLHGSVTNYGSLIATDDDYEKCYRDLRSGLVGSNLRMLLATQTVLFVGYSLRDQDFTRVYEFLRREMRELIPHAFVVTVSPDEVPRLEKMGFTAIVTDAAYFVNSLKKRLIETKAMLSDERFDQIDELWLRTNLEHRRLHKEFSPRSTPEIIFCASYQDGLMHSLERIMSRQKSGEYSCEARVGATLRSYAIMRQQKLRQKMFHDVAYIDGYTSGLLYLLADDRLRAALPFYYTVGHENDLRSMAQFKRALGHLSKSGNAAKLARKLAADLVGDVVCHHQPFLL